MDLTEKLRAWGAAHAQARSAEQRASQGTEDLRQQARSLRQIADRLHREIYEQMGRKGSRPA